MSSVLVIIKSTNGSHKCECGASVSAWPYIRNVNILNKIRPIAVIIIRRCSWLYLYLHCTHEISRTICIIFIIVIYYIYAHIRSSFVLISSSCRQPERNKNFRTRTQWTGTHSNVRKILAWFRITSPNQSKEKQEITPKEINYSWRKCNSISPTKCARQNETEWSQHYTLIARVQRDGSVAFLGVR